MDMMSDFENMDVILESDNVTTIERELFNVIGNVGGHFDNESYTYSLEKMILAKLLWTLRPWKHDP